MIFFSIRKNVSVAFICISLTQIEYQTIQDVGRIMENQNIKQDVPFGIVHSWSMLGFMQTVTYDVHKSWFLANPSCFVYATRIPLISRSFKIFWWKSWKMLRCYNISISLCARKKYPSVNHRQPWKYQLQTFYWSSQMSQMLFCSNPWIPGSFRRVNRENIVSVCVGTFVCHFQYLKFRDNSCTRYKSENLWAFLFRKQRCLHLYCLFHDKHFCCVRSIKS